MTGLTIHKTVWLYGLAFSGICPLVVGKGGVLMKEEQLLNYYPVKISIFLGKKFFLKRGFQSGIRNGYWVVFSPKVLEKCQTKKFFNKQRTPFISLNYTPQPPTFSPIGFICVCTCFVVFLNHLQINGRLSGPHP